MLSATQEHFKYQSFHIRDLGEWESIYKYFPFCLINTIKQVNATKNFNLHNYLYQHLLTIHYMLFVASALLP